MSKKPKPARRASLENYAEATAQARALQEGADWLSAALDHHDQIRAAFERALLAPPGGARVTAMKGLALVLTGHSLAEEVVLYPALERSQGDAGRAYEEQSHAKIEMARLELIDPATPHWAEHVQTIREAVLQHMFEEESEWFPKIKSDVENQAKLTARFREEFERYTRSGIVATNAAWDAPPLPERATS